VLLPAVLELLGPFTWKLPRWIDTRLPHINIEGSAARDVPEPPEIELGGEAEAESTRVGH
jgi:putative drug exporter of the RND superfamily